MAGTRSTDQRLLQIATGITATTSAGQWPGPGSTDQRLLQIAHNLSRARILVERYGGDVQPTTADVRADIAAPGQDHAQLPNGPVS
jgi:hypothetical protein